MKVYGRTLPDNNMTLFGRCILTTTNFTGIGTLALLRCYRRGTSKETYNSQPLKVTAPTVQNSFHSRLLSMNMNQRTPQVDKMI